jgi:DNA phosphorothioation-dependent restriction protein DptG
MAFLTKLTLENKILFHKFIKEFSMVGVTLNADSLYRCPTLS